MYLLFTVLFCYPGCSFLVENLNRFKNCALPFSYGLPKELLKMKAVSRHEWSGEEMLSDCVYFNISKIDNLKN